MCSQPDLWKTLQKRAEVREKKTRDYKPLSWVELCVAASDGISPWERWNWNAEFFHRRVEFCNDVKCLFLNRYHQFQNNEQNFFWFYIFGCFTWTFGSHKLHLDLWERAAKLSSHQLLFSEGAQDQIGLSANSSKQTEH